MSGQQHDKFIDGKDDICFGSKYITRTLFEFRLVNWSIKESINQIQQSIVVSVTEI